MLLATVKGPPVVARDDAPATVSAPLPSAVLLPSVSVPALSVVPPLNVFEPDRVSPAAPFLTRLPAPEIGPDRPSACVPGNVSVAPRLTALPSVVPALLLKEALPVTFSGPPPNAVAEPATRLPPDSTVPPV